MRIVAFLLAATAAVAAGGAAGKWSGVIIVEDPNGNGPIRTAVELELAERGERAVDGTIGRKGDRERVAIKNGSVQGATVRFEASSVETATPMRFTLKLDGDKLEGDMRGSVDSGQIAGKAQFSREKE